MSRVALLWSLVLSSALLAGCTAGDDAQAPLETADSDGQSGAAGAPNGPNGGQSDDRGQPLTDDGNATWNETIHLEVTPEEGLAPLDVTLTYDVRDEAASSGGNDGNASAGGNATAPSGNATGNGTADGSAGADGNGTSASGNATGSGSANGTAAGGPGQAQGNATGFGNGTSSAGLTWTLRLWRLGDNETPSDGGGPNGNQTGNGATNQTAGNTTAGNGTTPGPTGSPPAANGTNGSAGTPGANGTESGNGTWHDGTSAGAGNLTLVINGTQADLPGQTVQRINATGHYKVVFEVTFANGTTGNRTAFVHVRGLQDGDALGSETRTFEGSFLASEPLLCTGAEEFPWVLNSTFAGHSARVDRLNATLDGSGVADDYELVFVHENGTELARGPSLDLDGPIGAGNHTLRVESCVAADTAYTVNGTVDYVFAGLDAADGRAEGGSP